MEAPKIEMSQAPQKVRSLVSQFTIPFNRDIKCGSLLPSLPYPCGQLKNVGGFITHSEAGLQLHAVDKIQSLNAFILPLSSVLMAEQRMPVSLSLPKPFSIWAHFLHYPTSLSRPNTRNPLSTSFWTGSVLIATLPSAVYQTSVELGAGLLSIWEEKWWDILFLLEEASIRFLGLTLVLTMNSEITSGGAQGAKSGRGDWARIMCHTHCTVALVPVMRYSVVISE